MADTTDSLILEILRQLRGDMAAMRSEMREGLDRLDVRMGLIEQALGSMLTVSASDRGEIRSLR